MKMIYRGVSFDSLVAGSPAAATEQTGTFLGSAYPIKQSQVAFRQPSEELTYRGVRYSR
ncbi:MAG TPA: DUF4278 domain-containing protein [Candidatus Obscuribacterales bacterium]